MSKLIIRHGERVTEHPIDDYPLVVGRDPQCDLFFADKKLSRRHARFERDDNGIRLVDLGSRNGCWVNDERVENKLLTPADSVRLGGLSISLEVEPESEPPTDEGPTVVLSSKDLPDAGPPQDAGTVIVPVQELKDDVEALRRGLVESLAEDRPYSELATIAKSFNELVQHRGGVSEGGTADGGSETFKPMVDPTLVPEEREQAKG